MRFVGWARIGRGAVFLALLGTAVTQMSSNPDLARRLFGALGAMGLVLLALVGLSQRDYTLKRAGLGQLLTEAEELIHRDVRTMQPISSGPPT